MKLANADPLSNAPWSYAQYGDGSPILDKHRIVYRERKDLQRDFKDPFDSLAYRKWITTQGMSEYPNLDSACSVKAFKDNYFSGLSTGYTGGEIAPTLVNLSRLMKNPVLAIKATISTFQNEGISGIRKKISRL